MNKNSNIGFIGLGNMGKPIFDNLNKNFSNIFCFDKDTSKLKKNNSSSFYFITIQCIWSDQS